MEGGAPFPEVRNSEKEHVCGGRKGVSFGPIEFEVPAGHLFGDVK